ncbi:MAG TPA: hypothetical protein VHS06_03210 [Chloroflexota bacterium]|nr:hypothetical protein [Chloroflexota bacterium]
MGLLDRVRSFFSDVSSGEVYVMYIYIRCKRCGEPIRLRMDRRFDLELEFGETLVSGFVANKDILGRKCSNLIRVHVEYDSSHRQKNRDIEGGQFITREEYEAGVAEQARPNP